MIELRITCSYCGEELVMDELDAIFDTCKPDISFEKKIEEVVTDNRWIFQKNGEHLDTYCSHRCAQ